MWLLFFPYGNTSFCHDTIVSSHSESPRQTSWLAAKNKIMKEKLKKSDQFFGAAKELIRLKRREKANDFVTHVQMAKAYKPFKKFEGIVH